MAVTKILVVRNKLERMVNYVNNPNKTSLENALDYAMNEQKTEATLFQSTINCMPGSAYQDMCETKRRWDNDGGVLAYHIIQAFEHGEVSPHTAHEIGCQFVQQLFGDRYEAVIATHLDKLHVHNHIVINSVSFADGKKYRSNIGTYYGEIRATSDALCKEYCLSVVQGERRGKHYGEWKNEKEDHVAWRDVIRRDIDEKIRQSLSLQQFYSKLRAQGYTIDVNPKHKYVTIRALGMERAVRLTAKSLGEDYTPENIAKRILSMPYIVTEPNRSSRSGHANHSVHSNRSKHIHLHGNRKPIKLKGLRALYFRYMYELGFIKKRPRRVHMSKELRAEVRKLDAYAARMRMLNDHKIETTEQLIVYRDVARDELTALTSQRTTLHRRKEGVDEPTRQELTGQTDAITKRLRMLREEIKLCDAIEGERSDLPVRLRQMAQAKEVEGIVDGQQTRKMIYYERGR